MLLVTLVLTVLVPWCHEAKTVPKKYKTLEYTVEEEQKLTLDLSDEVINESPDVEIVLRESSLLFYMEDNTLKSHVAINREKVCQPLVEVCEVVLDLWIKKNSELFDILKLKLTVHDVNDHPPKFQQHRLVLNLTEDHDPLSAIELPAASDLDGPLFNILRYTLTGSPQFSLFEEPSEPQEELANKPKMVLNSPLDREAKDFHRLVLTAVDKGDPPKSSSINIGL